MEILNSLNSLNKFQKWKLIRLARKTLNPDETVYIPRQEKYNKYVIKLYNKGLFTTELAHDLLGDGLWSLGLSD